MSEQKECGFGGQEVVITDSTDRTLRDRKSFCLMCRKEWMNRATVRHKKREVLQHLPVNLNSKT